MGRNRFAVVALLILCVAVLVTSYYHIWHPDGYLGEQATLLKIVLAMLAFPICMLVVLAYVIVFQAIMGKPLLDTKENEEERFWERMALGAIKERERSEQLAREMRKIDEDR